MTCRSHPTTPATHLANMPDARSPYYVDIPLCAVCGGHIRTIGFPVRDITETP